MSTPYVDLSSIQPYLTGLNSLQNYNSSNIGTTGGAWSNPGTSGMFGMSGSDPSSLFNGNIGSSGGKTPSNPIDAISSFFGGLFGSSGKSGFTKYIDSNGNLVTADPNTRNATPLPSVPGAKVTPNSKYLNAAENTQILSDLSPYLNQATASGTLSDANAQLAASQMTSPGYAQLMTNLYNTYGPQLNAIGNQIQNQNALAQAQTTNDVLNGPGAQTVQQALALQQQVDPNFYATQNANAGAVQKLLQTTQDQLGGGLSNTENAEIQKGLALQNARAGTSNAPSQTNAVSNAMQFGNAGYQRKQQALSNFSNAITQANSFLPQSKSGLDAFQIATGRSSQANPGQSNTGNSLFPGTSSTSSNNAYGLAGNLLGGMQQTDLQQMAQNFTAQQNSFGNQFSKSAGSALGGLAGSGGTSLLGILGI